MLELAALYWASPSHWIWILTATIATVVLGTLCLSWRISRTRCIRTPRPDISNEQHTSTDLQPNCPNTPRTQCARVAHYRRHRRCRTTSALPIRSRCVAKDQTHSRRRLTIISHSGPVPQSLRGMPGGFGQGQQAQQHTGRGGANRLQNGKLGKATRRLCSSVLCGSCVARMLIEAYSNTAEQQLWLGFWWWRWPYERGRHSKSSSEATKWQPGGSNVCAEPNRLNTSNTTGFIVSATCISTVPVTFAFQIPHLHLPPPPPNSSSFRIHRFSQQLVTFPHLPMVSILFFGIFLVYNG